MDVTVSGSSLKTLYSAVQCLTKIGKEIYFEAKETELTLRALNEAKSAFSAFTFHRDDFFDAFECGLQNDEPISCKVTSKALQHVFKSLKKVLSLRMYIGDAEGTEPHMVLDMQCETGVFKRLHLHIQDCEMTTALFDKNGASYLSTGAQTFLKYFDHMHGGHDVALVASASEMRIRSWRSEDAKGGILRDNSAGLGQLTTEMTIASSEFVDGFVYVGEEGSSTVLALGIRELKAFLSFCEACSFPSIQLYYHSCGGPVLFAAESSVALSAQLIVATMPDVASSLPPRPGANKARSSITQSAERSRKRSPTPSDQGNCRRSSREIQAPIMETDWAAEQEDAATDGPEMAMGEEGE